MNLGVSQSVINIAMCGFAFEFQGVVLHCNVWFYPQNVVYMARCGSVLTGVVALRDVVCTKGCGFALQCVIFHCTEWFT